MGFLLCVCIFGVFGLFHTSLDDEAHGKTPAIFGGRKKGESKITVHHFLNALITLS